MQGNQFPRISCLPKYSCSAGEEAVELCSMIGLELDPWQQFVLENSLGEDEEGKWAAFQVGLVVARQNGKGPASVTTPVLTGNGWTTLGEVEPGDSVYGGDGRPIKVVACSEVYLNEPCYEVTFTDGAKHVVTADHLWWVKHKDRRQWEAVQTADIARKFASERANGRMEYLWRVRCDAVPETPEADLPIHPYILGLWLGDGTSRRPELTVSDEDRPFMRGVLQATGHVVTNESLGNREHDPWHIAFRLGPKMNKEGFPARLRWLNVYRNKHIPEIYLAASKTQRLELLRGLMDTDGSVATTNKSPQVEFSTSSEALALGFQRLVRSLGIRVTPKRRKTTHKDNWRFLWTPTFNPFRLPRKATKYKAPLSKRQELMSVIDVQPVSSVPTRCIQVDSEDGVYLLGHHFTPTHNCVLQARELAGLFLDSLSERFMLHSAHRYDTSQEHFHRLVQRIEGSEEFSKRVKRISRSHNEEGITMLDGRQLRFRARTSVGGLGFTIDTLVCDEAQILPQSFLAALLPTLSARPNPQIWFAGTAADQERHEDAIVLATLREQAQRGDTQSVCYMEWSFDSDHPLKVTPTQSLDPEVWAQANPSMGIRIADSYIGKEREALAPRDFAVERLGVGDWPRTDGLEGVMITPEAWAACTDEASQIVGPVCFAVDVTPDRSYTAIAVGGFREDGKTHVEIVEHKRGTGWVVKRLDELLTNHRGVAICDATGPVASLLPELKEQRPYEEPVLLSSREQAQACGYIYDAVEQDTIRHIGQRELSDAIRVAVSRPLGDAWAWSRRNATGDISPLVAATMALWGTQTLEINEPAVIDTAAIEERMRQEGTLVT